MIVFLRKKDKCGEKWENVESLSFISTIPDKYNYNVANRLQGFINWEKIIDLVETKPSTPFSCINKL